MSRLSEQEGIGLLTNGDPIVLGREADAVRQRLFGDTATFTIRMCAGMNAGSVHSSGVRDIRMPIFCRMMRSLIRCGRRSRLAEHR